MEVKRCLFSATISTALPSPAKPHLTPPSFVFPCRDKTTHFNPIPNSIFGLNYPYARFRSSASAILIREQNPAAISATETQSLPPRVDLKGRFCSPRAARELALLNLYAACLQGSDPVRLFDKRVNGRTELGCQFDKESLVEYNHMSFGGPPVTTDSLEEHDELLQHDQKQSEIEAEVLSAPPKLVYNKLVLRFTRKLLVAVAESWNNHVLVIAKIAPPDWKNEPAARILEFSILHLAMSEIAVLGTKHPIVINEAVDLAKRFCDGAAPRIINGCLRTFVKE